MFHQHDKLCFAKVSDIFNEGPSVNLVLLVWFNVRDRVECAGFNLAFPVVMLINRYRVIGMMMSPPSSHCDCGRGLGLSKRWQPSKRNHQLCNDNDKTCHNTNNQCGIPSGYLIMLSFNFSYFNGKKHWQKYG